MRFRASNLGLLLAIVVAIGAAVLLTALSQVGASKDAADESARNRDVLAAAVDLQRTIEAYVLAPDPALLDRFDEVNLQAERAIVSLEDAPGAGDHPAVGRQAEALGEMRALGTAAIERAGDGGSAAATAGAEKRADAFDAVVAANEELVAQIDDDLQASQLRSTVVALATVLLLGGVILALGRAARGDDLRRLRKRRFAEGLQAARSEREAYELVRAQLERSVDRSQVAVFNRNNSANRLEASTELDEDGDLAVALRGAGPDDCLAIRTARPSSGGTDENDLLTCEICGRRGEAALCVPSIVGGEVIGSVLVRRPDALDESDERAALETVSEAAPVIAHLRNIAIAESRAASDKLTGLANKRAAEDGLKRMLAEAQRGDEPLAVIMFDLDHFKRINDSHGHPKGDEVLAAVGSAMRAVAREQDFAARYGGEEFLLLARGCDRDGGRGIAEKLRSAISELDIPELGRAVTASFGVAALGEDGETGEELIRKADRALYVAKHEGRNRVKTAGHGAGGPGDPASSNGGSAAVRPSPVSSRAG